MRNRLVLLIAAGSNGFRRDLLTRRCGDLADALCRRLVRLLFAPFFLYLSFGLFLLAVLFSVLFFLFLLLLAVFGFLFFIISLLFFLLALSLLLLLVVTVRSGAVLEGSIVGRSRF